MKSKGGRPRKEVENLRVKNVMVSFSISEWETLNSNMDKSGHDSPAIFLRASGLRSKVPAKVFVPEPNRRLHDKLIDSVNAIKDMHSKDYMNSHTAGEYLVSLRSIANDLIDTAAYKRIELMQLEIQRLTARINGGAK